MEATDGTPQPAGIDHDELALHILENEGGPHLPSGEPSTSAVHTAEESELSGRVIPAFPPIHHSVEFAGSPYRDWFEDDDGPDISNFPYQAQTVYRDADDSLHPAVITATHEASGTFGIVVFYPHHLDFKPGGIRMHQTDTDCILG